MSSTRRIERLLKALEERGWTESELRDVEEIVGKDPTDSYRPVNGSRPRRPFEIQGDWGDAQPELRLDDSPPVRNASLPSKNLAEKEGPSADRPSPPASTEERLAHLEALAQLQWKAIHSLEEKLAGPK